MLIPSKQANLIREAEGVLFFHTEGTKNDRIRVFYKLLRPLLSWLKEDIINTFNIESDEAESEIYIFCAKLYNKYNPTKSSIIPFLLKFIPLCKTNLYYQLNKKTIKEIPSGLLQQEDSPSYTQEEYYYIYPKIIFEDRYIGKSFTFTQKYIINELLMLDNDELNNLKLAEKLNLSRQTTAKKLEEIAQTWRKIYETTL